MKQFIAILTGMHVLAHGVFGCCEHRLDMAAAPEMAATAKSCCCHHGVRHDQHARAPRTSDVASQATPQRPSHQCIHSTCHWLAATAGRGIQPLDFSLPVAFVATSPTMHSALSAAEFRPIDVMGRTSAPALRLHLVVGVLIV